MNKIYQTKKEISQWLDCQNVENYTLIASNHGGFTVNVEGSVRLNNKKLTHIPVQFGSVSDHFYCGYNQLTSLEGCAVMVGGSFDCSHNNLTSLLGSPKIVGEHFACMNNQLTSLEGGPKEVEGYFWCDYNPALGPVQKITDVADVYRAHFEFKIHTEKNTLAQNLTCYKDTQKTYKI